MCISLPVTVNAIYKASLVIAFVGGKLEAKAVGVLNDWNSGKLRYYTQLPENSKQVDVGSAQFCSSQLLNVFSKEVDLDALDDEQKVLVEGLLSGSAMDVDLLYQRNVTLKSEEDETNMDIDDDTTSQQRSVVVDPTKVPHGGVYGDIIGEMVLSNGLPPFSVEERVRN
ncbi:unnamed protein product [Toxocara canis]|uniref:CPSF_A domain-containing protein n=1 Tax=Toxocara canis TaxID=6265 RepID=A0A183V9D8_TOXCA|nr:unnamed protein product [Toxocara canis]